MNNTFIIGIAGGTGSGKTTVVNQIINELPTNEMCVISQDSYYNKTDELSPEDRIKINFDQRNELSSHQLHKQKTQFWNLYLAIVFDNNLKVFIL